MTRSMDALREWLAILERQVTAITEGALLMNVVHERILALEYNVGEGNDLGGTLIDLVKTLIFNVTTLQDDVVLIKRQLAAQHVALRSKTCGIMKIHELKAFEGTQSSKDLENLL